MGFVTDDPAAIRILQELAKLPDGAIWEVVALETELSDEALRESSLLAALLLYIQPEINNAKIRFLKVGTESPVSPRDLLQRLLKCRLPVAASVRFGEVWEVLDAEGRLPRTKTDVFKAVDEALRVSGLPAALTGLIKFGSGEQQLVFICLKNVVAYQHLWNMFCQIAGWLLENKIEIDGIEAV